MKTQEIIDNYVNKYFSEKEDPDLNVFEKNGEMVIFYEGGEIENHPLPEDWENFIKNNTTQ